MRVASTQRTDDDRVAYETAVRAIASIDEDAMRAGFELARIRSLDRGQYLLRAGQVATQVAIVVEGLLREHFVMADGVERTKAFVRAGELTGSLADLLAATPSRAFIVCEEPARLLVMPYGEMQSLARKFRAWRRFGARATERLLLVKAEREYELLGLDAQARYAAFSRRYPGLEARVAAKHVASYLGITPVHLSRLRRARSGRTTR